MKELEILLNRRWILKSEDKELYYRVRDAVGEIRKYVTDKLGCQIIDNSLLIKLEKIPVIPEQFMGIGQFSSKEEYVYLCILLMFLEDKDAQEQFILSQLTEYMTAVMPGEITDWTLYNNRRKLIRVLRYTVEQGMVRVTDGTDDVFMDDAGGEVLYENTGASKYFMRNFYSNNRDAMKSSKRKEYSITELAYDDSTALHRAAKKLKNYKYSDDENTDNIRQTVMALVDTYNNSIDSASNSSSTSMKRYAKQLKKLAGKYTDELEDIGITINKDGTLKANEELVKKADTDTLNSLFGNDNDFTSSLYRVSRQMSSSSYDDYYTSLRTGSNINLTV